MAEHRDITDPLLHEPKGISDLAGGVPDANKVYVSDGAGSGVWTNLPNQNPPYIEIDIVSPAGIVVSVGGTGIDIRDPVSYTQIIQNYSSAGLENGFTLDGVTGEIIVPVDGIYQTQFWISLTDSIGNNVLAIAASVDGSFAGVLTRPVYQTKTRDASNVIAVPGGSIAQLTGGQKIGVGFAAESAGNVTVFDSSITITLIKEL